MNRFIKRLFIFFVFVFAIIYLRNRIINKFDQKKHFKEIIGAYQFDLNQTQLLDDYLVDSLKYRKLQLQFYKDHTFKLNFDVPFINATNGTWTAWGSDIEELCQIHLKSGRKIGTFELFTTPDSGIILHNIMPKGGFRAQPLIYFKKSGIPLSGASVRL